MPAVSSILVVGCSTLIFVIKIWRIRDYIKWSEKDGGTADEWPCKLEAEKQKEELTAGAASETTCQCTKHNHNSDNFNYSL